MTQLPDKGILIAPAYMHSALRLAYLRKSQGSIGLSIVSLSTFLGNYCKEEIDDVEKLLVYRQRVQQVPCLLYKNIVDTLDFLSQCATFIEDMKLYKISIEELPQATPAQVEMKDILSVLYDIPSKMDELNKALQNISTLQLEHVYIMDAYYTYREEHMLAVLQSAHAVRISLEETRSKTEFFNAMNKRKEVEAMAQQIIRKKQKSEDISIVVCDASYKALIAQIFHRYEIPYTIMKETSASIITKRFTLLLQYYLHPHTDILVELIQCNTFKAPNLQSLLSYLQRFQMNIDEPFTHVKDKGVVSELISASELEQLSLIEEQAQLCKNEIYPSLEKLQSLESIEDIFQQIHYIASATIRQSDVKHITSLKKLHLLLVVLAKYIHKSDDLDFAIDVLSRVQESAPNKQLQGVFITDLNAPLPPRSICYVLGCTQKNYPAVAISHGLFDEAYSKEIPNYPSMRIRYDHHMKQITHHLNLSSELTVSYPLGGYDGKSNESALEMEQFLSIKAQPFPLYEHYQPISSTFSINQESAKALFVKEDVIPGSVSSFERYVRCPFSYFLSYGLRLREPISYQFSPERIGTLAHYIMETLVKTYQKEYVDVSIDEVEHLLQQELQAMASIYPSFQPYITITKKRMLHSLAKNLEYLKDMEEHAHLSEVETEREFWWDLSLAEGMKIRFHGFIDRIDSSSGYTRILDYKSSIRKLNEAEVFAGVKLQLLTYALYIQEEEQKQVLGTYYYSLKQENISIAAGSMKRRPVQYMASSKEDYDTLRHASNKLQGWTMEHDVDIIDDDATHIQGVRQNKDGLIEARKTYDLAVLKQHMLSIYTTIGKHILQGDIACNPTSDACMFCAYRDICRFNGYPRAIEPFVEVDESIYKGGA